jgi:DnaK suppressor protein
MEHLTRDQLTELRAGLDDIRSRILARVDAVRAEVPEVERQDGAVIEDARIRDGRLNGRDRRRLAEVEAALQRMDEGSYGICEETGEPIPFARLRAEPTTRWTVEAAEGLEAAGEPAGDGEPEAY